MLGIYVTYNCYVYSEKIWTKGNYQEVRKLWNGAPMIGSKQAVWENDISIDIDIDIDLGV